MKGIQAVRGVEAIISRISRFDIGAAVYVVGVFLDNRSGPGIVAGNTGRLAFKRIQSFGTKSFGGVFGLGNFHFVFFLR